MKKLKDIVKDFEADMAEKEEQEETSKNLDVPEEPEAKDDGEFVEAPKPEDEVEEPKADDEPKDEKPEEEPEVKEPEEDKAEEVKEDEKVDEDEEKVVTTDDVDPEPEEVEKSADKKEKKDKKDKADKEDKAEKSEDKEDKAEKSEDKEEDCDDEDKKAKDKKDKKKDVKKSIEDEEETPSTDLEEMTAILKSISEAYARQQEINEALSNEISALRTDIAKSFGKDEDDKAEDLSKSLEEDTKEEDVEDKATSYVTKSVDGVAVKDVDEEKAVEEPVADEPAEFNYQDIRNDVIDKFRAQASELSRGDVTKYREAIYRAGHGMATDADKDLLTTFISDK